MHTLLEWTTGLGDAVLLLPCSLVILTYFLRRQSPESATSWATALLISISVTAVLKVCFHACGAMLPWLDIRSPSGHVSLATTFYLSAGVAAAATRPPWARAMVLLPSAILVLAIAVSRVALHVHTLAEVAGGGIIGLAGAAWFARGYAPTRAVALDWRLAAAPFLGLALMTHGWHVGIESLVPSLAARLQAAAPICSGEPSSAALAPRPDPPSPG